jgi:hypothetical protein
MANRYFDLNTSSAPSHATYDCFSSTSTGDSTVVGTPCLRPVSRCEILDLGSDEKRTEGPPRNATQDDRTIEAARVERRNAVVEEGEEGYNHQRVIKIAKDVKAPHGHLAGVWQQGPVHEESDETEGCKDVGELLSAEGAGEQRENDRREKDNNHVADLGDHFGLRPGETPAEEIESVATDVVEIDEQRFFYRFENPERGDDREPINEHQDDERPFALLHPCGYSLSCHIRVFAVSTLTRLRRF